MKNRLLPRSGFTLIEILVVIGIIAILMGLLFPAVNGALNGARKAAAKNDVVQIATAVIAYQAEYGKLPSSASTVSGTLLTELTGSNARKLTFLDAPTAKKGKSGISNGTTYVDPWGAPYNIVLDSSYTGSVSALGATITRPVAVYGSVNTYITSTNNIPTSW